MYHKESLTLSSTVILSTNFGGSKVKRISSRRTRQIVKRLLRRQYDPAIIERTICLVLYPFTALYRSFLKRCTLTNKAVGTIWRALSKPPQRRQGPDPSPLWLLVGTPSAFGPELAYRLCVAQPTLISNPGKHGYRRRIREKSILTTFKWKVCVLNDIQLKWYLHHCVGLKLNFQVIYLFWCLARPVRCFREVFAIHGTTFRYARLVEKIGALWSRSVHVNTKTRGQTLLNIHEILYPIRLYLHLSADFRTILICKKTPEIWRTKVNGPPYDYF